MSRELTEIQNTIDRYFGSANSRVISVVKYVIDPVNIFLLVKMDQIPYTMSFRYTVWLLKSYDFSTPKVATTQK